MRRRCKSLTAWIVVGIASSRKHTILGVINSYKNKQYHKHAHSLHYKQNTSNDPGKNYYG